MKDKLAVALDVAGSRRISPDLWGVFFEDISHSADGGLSSELVQNGAFEYSRMDRPDWSKLYGMDACGCNIAHRFRADR